MSADEVVQRYLSGESSVELTKACGITDRSIRRMLVKSGVTLRNKSGKQPKYGMNVDFFKTWSPEMAYVLGFILTDGCVVGNTMTIAQKDVSILRRIASAMNAEQPIHSRINTYGNPIHTLQISRKEIVDDLRKLGISEKKSLVVPFPNVPDEYTPHFIRGVTDGDGWVHAKGYTMNVTSGSAAFANGLHLALLQRGYNARITQDSAYRIWVSGKNDVSRLGRWLYDGCGDLFLPRKRERFEINAA